MISTVGQNCIICGQYFYGPELIGEPCPDCRRKEQHRKIDCPFCKGTGKLTVPIMKGD